MELAANITLFLIFMVGVPSPQSRSHFSCSNKSYCNSGKLIKTVTALLNILVTTLLNRPKQHRADAVFL